MPSFIQRVAGKVGKAIDVVGRAAGNRLPELNISESLQSFGGARPGSTYQYVPPTRNQVLGSSTPFASQNALSQYTFGTGSSVPTTATNQFRPTTGGGGGGIHSGQVPAGNAGLEQNINRETEDLGAILDRDYETTIGALAGQEQGLRGQAGASEESIRAGYGPARTAVQEQQASKMARS